MNQPPRICTFESRREAEMAKLISKFGGLPVSAPSMREVPLDENQPAVSGIRSVVSGSADALVLMTGVGTEAMLKIAESADLKDQLLKTMGTLPLLIRGPKPAAVLRKLNLPWAVKAPEPNTWEDLLVAIDESDVPVNGRTIVVQEYGIPNPQFYDGLKDRGATVEAMPVYRWALPENLEPLKTAIRNIVDGEIDAALFTSAQQVRHVLQIAEEMKCCQQLRASLSRIMIASIGPTCSETLRSEDLPIHFEASPPKMGPLVRGVMQQLQSQKTL